MMALRVIPNNKTTFTLSPGVIAPLNADFDGDEMSLYFSTN